MPQPPSQLPCSLLVPTVFPKSTCKHVLHLFLLIYQAFLKNSIRSVLCDMASLKTYLSLLTLLLVLLVWQFLDLSVIISRPFNDFSQDLSG